MSIHVSILMTILSSRVDVRACSGNLPPEARREQAKLFSDPQSGFDVLVASDAIGMGLNLAIRRIVFSTVTKFDGFRERKLHSSVSNRQATVLI